jgi:hypothetical protein
MRWTLSHRAARRACVLADRHYNRQSAGSPQFIPPGSPVALVYPDEAVASAVWVTLRQKFQDHAWPGAWVNTLFRKECDGDASEFIRDALAATRFIWPDIPPQGLITFIDPNKVKARLVRGRTTWGHCYFMAGFKHVGYTKGGLWVFQIHASDWPEPIAPLGAQLNLDHTHAKGIK